VVNNGVDRPWSQYFCCMLAGSTEYVKKYPVATKQIIRAVLKGADLCVSSASSVARQLVDTGYLARYEDALQTLNDLRYDTWREFDAQDSVRFYALRMQELGMIKSSPQKVIADGTDWHFLNELKRELKS
jgi:NitT/TauT family transport system substrate-binding protein